MASWRALALLAIVFGVLALRGCERYTPEFQTLPPLDWLDARLFSEAVAVPPAADLGRGLAQAVPSLPLLADAVPYSPDVGPPGRTQVTASGVRDAARIAFGSVVPPATRDGDQVSVSLEIIVFHRAQRAAAWAEIVTREMDIRDPQSGALQFRTGGPGEPDRVWVTVPREVAAHTGESTVLGARGPVSFQLKARVVRSTTRDPQELVELAGRAEALARGTATAWTEWLAGQPGVQSPTIR